MFLIKPHLNTVISIVSIQYYLQSTTHILPTSFIAFRIYTDHISKEEVIVSAKI